MSHAINDHVLTRKKSSVLIREFTCARAVEAQLLLSISGPLVFSVSVAEMKIEIDTGRNDEQHRLTCCRNVNNIQLSTIRIDGKQPLHFVNSATMW